MLHRRDALKMMGAAGAWRRRWHGLAPCKGAIVPIQAGTRDYAIPGR